MTQLQRDRGLQRGSLVVFSAIQEIATGRVFLLLRDGDGFYWTRARRGRAVRGPYKSLALLFADMAVVEGRTAAHWLEVFARFHPDIDSQAGTVFDA